MGNSESVEKKSTNENKTMSAPRNASRNSEQEARKAAQAGKELFDMCMETAKKLTVGGQEYRKKFYKDSQNYDDGFMKEAHFELFIETCRDAGIDSDVTRTMIAFIQKNADKNGDGKISGEEFAEVMVSNPTIFTKGVMSALLKVLRTPGIPVEFQETKMGCMGYDKYGNRVRGARGPPGRGPPGYGGGYGGFPESDEDFYTAPPARAST